MKHNYKLSGGGFHHFSDLSDLFSSNARPGPEDICNFGITKSGGGNHHVVIFPEGYKGSNILVLGV